MRKTKQKLSMLKKIRRNLDLQQFLRIATTQIYCPVQLSETLRSDYWHRLKSLHYKVLRASVRDLKQRVPKSTLDQRCKRVSLKTWSLFSMPSIVIKAQRDRSPNFINEVTNETIHTTWRQPVKAHLYNNSKGKVGKHCLCKQL